VLLFRSWICLKMGDDQGAMTAMDTALQYAEPQIVVMPFVRTFQYLEKLLRKMAEKGIHRDLLDRIFTICQATPSVSADGDSKDLHFIRQGLIEPLTERELEILRLLNSHLPTPEIADMLAVSVNTVRTHIKSIYAKLGVHSRTTAIDLSKKLKLLA
jgi:LuxR family transcriptional regulator, maltose regulon positive regulatory protein